MSAFLVLSSMAIGGLVGAFRTWAKHDKSIRLFSNVYTGSAVGLGIIMLTIYKK